MVSVGLRWAQPNLQAGPHWGTLRGLLTIMYTSIQFFACLCAVLVSQLAEAQVRRDYRCTIERVTVPQDSSSQSLALREKSYLNREFTVDRQSGLMAGTLKNSYLTKPQVIDFGSNDNSYKVITTMRREQGAGVGSNVYVLVVNEYEKGARKPFVFLENDNIYFGYCIHF